MTRTRAEQDRIIQLWTRAVVNWTERGILALMVGFKFGAWYGWVTLVTCWVIIGLIQGTVRSVKEWGRWPYT